MSRDTYFREAFKELGDDHDCCIGMNCRRRAGESYQAERRMNNCGGS